MSGGGATGPVGGANTAEVAVGHVLDDLRSVRLRFVPPILLGFIMLFDSWDSVAISYVMPSLTAEWQLKPVSMGALISSGYAGQFVGAMLLGMLAERFGRMPVFLVAMTLMSLLAIGCAISPDYWTLIVLRFVQGVMIGGALPVAITYINELAPTSIRGRYFGTFQFICMAGYAAAAQSSAIVIPHLGWRWLFGLGVIPLALLPLVVLLLPESPRWLARLGRIDDVNRALAKLGGPPIAVDAELATGGRKAPAAAPTRVKALFASDYRKRSIIIISLWFFTSFATFGLTTWVPSIYVREFKIPVADALAYAAISSTLYLFASPIVAAVMDHTGRRPLALGGTLIAAVALLSLAVHIPDSRTVLIALVVLGALSISIGSLIVWPYTAESYPTRLRAVGLGMASATARGASMLTPLIVGGILAESGSVRVVFGVVGTCALIAFLLWLTATRETARMSLDDLK